MRSFISVVQKTTDSALKAKQVTFLEEDWNCLLFVCFLLRTLCKQHSSYCHHQLLVTSERVLSHSKILGRNHFPSLRQLLLIFMIPRQHAETTYICWLRRSLCYSTKWVIRRLSEIRARKGRVRWADRRKNGSLTGANNLPHRSWSKNLDFLPVV